MAAALRVRTRRRVVMGLPFNRLNLNDFYTNSGVRAMGLTRSGLRAARTGRETFGSSRDRSRDDMERLQSGRYVEGEKEFR